VAGGAALLFARWLYTSTAPQPQSTPDSGGLDPAARAVVAAIIPVFLDGALPSAAEEASGARAATLSAVERLVAGLPPATRKELTDLFALLVFPPSRCLIAGVWSPWPEATREAIASFLERWSGSRFMLLRSAYAALHQLVFSAWYANPLAWPAIGYPGPPSLESG
jgi:hypothetical protein